MNTKDNHTKRKVVTELAKAAVVAGVAVAATKILSDKKNRTKIKEAVSTAQDAISKNVDKGIKQLDNTKKKAEKTIDETMDTVQSENL